MLTYSVKITNNATTDYQDVPIRIVLDADSPIDWTVLDPTTPNIGFLDGNTPLYYWVETWDVNNQYAVIWVKIPYLLAQSTKEITLVTGTTDYTQYNDGTQVFSFFDSFEGSTNWTLYTSGTNPAAVIDNTRAHTGQYSIKLPGNTGYNEGITRPVTVTDRLALVMWLYYDSPTQGHLLALKDDNGNWVGPHVTLGETSNTADPISGDEGNICYFTGTWICTNVVISAGSWHRLELVLKLDTQKFDLYLDGQLVVSDGGFVGNLTDGAQYYIITDVNGSANTFPDMWVDDTYQRPYIDPDIAIEITPTTSTAQLQITNTIQTWPIGTKETIVVVDYFKAQDIQTLRLILNGQNYNTQVDQDVLSQPLNSLGRLRYILPGTSSATNSIDLTQLTYDSYQQLTDGQEIDITNKMAYIAAMTDTTLELIVANNDGTSINSTQYSLAAGQALVFIAMPNASTIVKINVSTGVLDVYLYTIPTLITESATLTFQEIDQYGNIVAEGNISINIATISVTGSPVTTQESNVTIVGVVAVI